MDNVHSGDTYHATGCDIIFSPPVYQQRYQRVLDLVRQLKIKKVVDFGCAECKFIKLLRNEQCVQEIVGVDIDGIILENHCKSIQPFLTDYLQQRSEPLTIRLFQGSVSEFDERLENYDLVTLIEVVEHLYPDILKDFPRNVFGLLHPQVIIITTPNADFNVLFKGLNPGKFRHWDHKFEWTRKEFKIWCENICEEYNYSVSYSGIGEGPKGSEKFGCCSQMAVFYRNESVHIGNKCQQSICMKTFNTGKPYKLIEESVYPYEDETERRKLKIEKLLNEYFEDIDHVHNARCDGGKLFSSLPKYSCYTFDCISKKMTGICDNKDHVAKMPESNNSLLKSCVPGQFDDAQNDISRVVVSNGYRTDLNYYVRPGHNKGYIRYLYNKYFKKTKYVVNHGQFDDAPDDEYQNISCDNVLLVYKYCTDSSIKVTNSTIQIPISTILDFKEFKDMCVTKKEIIDGIGTKRNVILGESRDLLFIKLNYSESENDSFHSDDSEISEDGENVIRSHTYEEFDDSDWDSE